MDKPVDEAGQSFSYHAPTSPNPMEKFGHSRSGSISHETAFGGDIFAGINFFDTIEPATLQVSHTSHDDSCVDACPGIYNAQGLPRSSYPPAAFTRSRLSTSSISFPYAFQSTESPFFPSASHNYDGAYSFLVPDADLKYPVTLSGRFIHHAASNGAHFSSPNNAPGICTLEECTIPNECNSKDCSRVSCSEDCCTDAPCSTVCEDECCEAKGLVCSDAGCLTGDPCGTSFDYMHWDLNDWSNFGQHSNHGFPSHDLPCNHTNMEHDVALTLRDLKEPGTAGHQQQQEQQQQQQQQFLNSFECAAFSHQEPTATASIETPALTVDTNITSPSPVGPSVSFTGLKETTSEQHVCRWLANGKICGQVFSNNEDLHQHLGKDHVGQMSSKTKYICLWEGCQRKDDQNFASRNKLRRHISTHTAFKPFKCEHCNERFSAQQALDQHIRTHTGEKPYECDVPGCGKAFKQKSALTMHKRTHTGEKPLVCEICGKSFCESSNLSKHRKIHNAEYKYKCTQCPRSFIRVDQLRRHQQKHDRDREKGRCLAAGLSQPEDLLSLPPSTDESLLIS